LKPPQFLIVKLVPKKLLTQGAHPSKDGENQPPFPDAASFRKHFHWSYEFLQYHSLIRWDYQSIEAEFDHLLPVMREPIHLPGNSPPHGQ
jgi:hypothetical protein